MSDAERLSARRAELEALWDKIFELVVISGKSVSWAQHIAAEAVNEAGDESFRDFTIRTKLKSEGFPVDQS